MLISVPGATEWLWVSFDVNAGWEQFCFSSCGVFPSSLASASFCLPEALQGVQHSAWEFLLFPYRALSKDPQTCSPAKTLSYGYQTAAERNGDSPLRKTLQCWYSALLQLYQSSYELLAAAYSLKHRGQSSSIWLVRFDFSMCWKIAHLFVFSSMVLDVSFLP